MARKKHEDENEAEPARAVSPESGGAASPERRMFVPSQTCSRSSGDPPLVVLQAMWSLP